MTRLPLALALCCVVAWTVAAQEAPTFSIRRENVRVDVLVTDRNRPVTGLRADDFELLDSGIRQQVDLLSLEQIPLNVILAFDTSASLTSAQVDALRDAARGILGALRQDDQAALVTFSNQVSLR